MKKYLLPALIIFAFIAIWFSPASINTPILSLLVLGIVPGTSVELGVALPLIAGGLAIIVLAVWLKQASAELMEFKTEVALREEAITTQQKTPASIPEDLPLNAEEIDLLSI